MVELAHVPPSRRLAVRATPDAAAALGEALGVALPTEPCRANASHERVALWLGPDEWLVLTEGDAALPAVPDAGIVDVSHGFIGIAVSGEHATLAINAFCALDLHVAVFPPGMCTRTLFGKAQIILWRIGPDVFRIEVARSFAPYVWDLLEEARREFLG